MAESISINDLKECEGKTKNVNLTTMKYIGQLNSLINLFGYSSEDNVYDLIDHIYENEEDIDRVCVSSCKSGRMKLKTFLQYFTSIHKVMKVVGSFRVYFGDEFANVVAFFETKSDELRNREDEFMERITCSVSEDVEESDEGDVIECEKSDPVMKQSSQSREVIVDSVKSNKVVDKVVIEKVEEKGVDKGKGESKEEVPITDVCKNEGDSNRDVRVILIDNIRYNCLKDAEIQREKSEYSKKRVDEALMGLKGEIRDDIWVCIQNMFDEQKQSENIESVKMVGRIIENMFSTLRKYSS